MDKSTMKLVFGIALAVIFLVLVIITVIYAKKNTEQKRKKASDPDYLPDQPKPDTISDTHKDYWVNKDDLSATDDPVAKLRYYHYFDNIDECLKDLIIEMYDCGLVRTEEIYTIAYGEDALTPDSLIFKTDIDEDDDTDYQLPPVSEDAQKKIYEKWTKYVDDLFTIIEISTSEHNVATIKDALMVYGRKDISVLLHSPE
ncbi:MAG: hypothetical protein ACI4EF_11845 [Coprococcus sp.]